jgi:hypothetical protein
MSLYHKYVFLISILLHVQPLCLFGLTNVKSLITDFHVAKISPFYIYISPYTSVVRRYIFARKHQFYLRNIY